jgi:hypothetical protein
MAFAHLPSQAAWRHHTARDGFEATFFLVRGAGRRLVGRTVAVEDGEAWSVGYTIDLDDRWRTRSAVVRSHTAAGELSVRLDADGAGGWRVDGVPAPVLAGCRDVDLESSACTNTLPIHRLALEAGRAASAPAAYVRAPGLAVERLDQDYRRVPDDGGHAPGDPGQRYDYRAPAFGVAVRLVFDAAGLVVDYPGLAIRSV